MWAFLSRRFRRWVLLAVAMPLLGRALERAGGAIEERRGETSVTRGMRGVGHRLGRRTR
ncbi:hypothetical protein BH20ACT9_BH20ACT9_11070 [soil metagenome]